jgi:hypothetical protein
MLCEKALRYLYLYFQNSVYFIPLHTSLLHVLFRVSSSLHAFLNISSCFILPFSFSLLLSYLLSYILFFSYLLFDIYLFFPFKRNVLIEYNNDSSVFNSRRHRVSYYDFCTRKPEVKENKTFIPLFIISFPYSDNKQKILVTCKSYFKRWFIMVAYIRGSAIWDTEIQTLITG